VLVLTISANADAAQECLRVIRHCSETLRLPTVAGLSNVSFGLPRRELLNAAFLAVAAGAGLDAAILNPLSAKYREVVDCCRVLNREDVGSARYIGRYGGEAAPAPAGETPESRDLREIILQGRREESAPKVREMLESMPPLEIINQWFVPALNAVGERFERGDIFLPQLMQSADAVKNGFDVIRAHVEQHGGGKAGGASLSPR
jgi:5-methyltetrahydrofolate--homocysteine methyltransferase